MPMFQKKIVEKYLKNLSGDVSGRYARFHKNFLDVARQKNIRESKEEAYQEGFLRELFVDCLGYAINPTPGFNLKTEWKNETDSRKADGAILIDGKAVGVIELKDHKTRDLRTVEAQAFGYKNNHPGARYVVISNFERLRFYIDYTAEYEEFDLFHLTEEGFRKLYLILAYENILAGIPLKIKEESRSEEKSITEKLYRDYSTFKRELFHDIQKRNGNAADKLVLFRKTQKLLDRLLFIFFAEDRGLIPVNMTLRIIDDVHQLRDLSMGVSLYERFQTYFHWIDAGHRGKDFEISAYNGGLFKSDELLDRLKIDDDLLERHTKILSAYDFESDVSVDILGHIFEHSLSEIEEIQNELNGVTEKKTSKRKKDGVFYTPAYITKYIVKNTVGALCENKKRELGIDLDEDAFRLREKALRSDARKRWMERFDAYRRWLLELSIVDPACGSGAFLNAVVQFLKEEHGKIDAAKAALFENGDDVQMALSDVECSILEKNIYGIDINDESVEIAKLSLWLHTARPGRKLSNLNGNVKCGNSLIDDAKVSPEKAFDWKREFPEVFANGGFDVVIGNPPYVSALELKKIYREEEYDFLKENYETAKGPVDLYVYFFEKGLSIIKNTGILSYITPNRFLSASYGKALRKAVLNQYSLKQLIDYSDKKVFPDASTYPVISVISRSESDFLICGKFDENQSLVKRSYPSDKLDILEDSILGFLLNDKLEITQKIIEQSESLVNVGQINATSTAKEADEYATLIVENLETGYKLVNTGTIDPYVEFWGCRTLIKQGKQFLHPCFSKADQRISENRRLLYSSPKIIISKIGLSCEAFYDKKGEFASIDTNCIHSFAKNYLPEYVLCWLNSKLYNYMFECLFDGLRMSGGYLLYSSPNLKNTYIKNISLEHQELFVSLADTMLAQNKSLQEKRIRFLRRVSENFENIKITVALEKFDELDFKKFLVELKKQKFELSLNGQDEWEEYFDRYKSECHEISKVIARTDREINQKVYSLYGLTAEEIAIVERAK